MGPSKALVNFGDRGEAAVMMTSDQQLLFYRHRFGRTMTPTDLALFERDLETCNLDVMSGALRQAEAAAQAAAKPPRDVRGAVLAQYDRGAAKLSQLFPVFFVFESAWRSFVAATLRASYGDDQWWHEIRDAVAQGADVDDISLLNGRPAAAELVRTIAHALAGTTTCGNLSTTYELLEVCGLHHVGKLIEFHWSIVADRLNLAASSAVSGRSGFDALFQRVRRARNDAYHHRVVAGRSEVLLAAEQLMDLLDVHLGARLERVAAQTPSPLTITMPIASRHG